MTSDVLVIDDREESYQMALEQAELIAARCELPKKDALHLRLLTEETMGLFRVLTGEVLAKFWIEAQDKVFRLHLTVRTQMDSGKRSELLSVSTSGKNAAAKGFTGKLRDILERAMDEAGASEDDDSAGSVIYGKGAAYAHWTMQQYQKNEMKRAEEKASEDDAWDELEKSIVGRLADDVSVGIRGREVEMVITMTQKTPQGNNE